MTNGMALLIFILWAFSTEHYAGGFMALAILIFHLTDGGV